MCVCVFWRSLCSNFFLDWETILRDFSVDWIIGWVVCWIAFIFVFFTSRKTVLKSWLDTSSIPCYLSSFLSFFLNAISTPPWYLVDRSRKLPAYSIAPRHLVDRSSFWSWIWFFVARYLSIPQLSSITEGSIYSSFAILLSFLRSLSICPQLFISQTLSFSLQTSSSRILQAFSSFSLLGKLLILSHSCISCFKT